MCVVQRDCCLAIIPTACTSKLHPLHHGLKENFKVPSTDRQSMIFITRFLFPMRTFQSSLNSPVSFLIKVYDLTLHSFHPSGHHTCVQTIDHRPCKVAVDAFDWTKSPGQNCVPFYDFKIRKKPPSPSSWQSIKCAKFFFSGGNRHL